MYVNMLAPLVVSVLYLQPLVESLLVPELLDEGTWKTLRMAFVVGALGLRLLTFREELQFHFNESYFYVQKLMIDKNEKVFRYIKLRIQENFEAVWFAIFQHASNFIVPVLLVLCYVNRLVAFTSAATSSGAALDFSKVAARAQQVEHFDLMSDSEGMNLAFQEVGAKGILTLDYYDGLFSYLIFWYFFSATFVNVFSLLYYRKFLNN